jgi:hypothetical protein
MLDWPLRLTLVKRPRLFAIEPPPHHLPEHRGPRSVEVRHQILQRGPRHGVQARVHADAGAWLVGPMCPWVHRRFPLVVDPQR